MATHALTTEQMQKFIDAIGGIPQSEVTGGQYSTEELRRLAEETGGLHDWPKITDDPQVNFAVDCVVADEGEEPTYDEQLYTADLEVWRKGGAFG